MPFNSIPIAIIAMGQRVETFTIEHGYLEAVMLGPEIAGTGNAEFFGQVFLASTETPTPIPIALLCSGYFGASCFIGWTGRILIEPTFAVHVRIFSESLDMCRLNILTDIGE